MRRSKALLSRAQRPDTADYWAAQVLRRGSSYSATSFAALRALDYDLALFGLKAKLLYLNPRIGNDITAAKVPLIARNGPGFDVLVSGSFAAWNEANGLANSSSGVMDTGINAAAPRSGHPSAYSMGVYMLADAPDHNQNRMIGSSASSGSPGLQPSVFTQLIIFDAWGSRVQTDNALIDDGTSGQTKGLISGTMVGNTGYVQRNSVIRGSGLNANAAATQTGTIRIFGAYCTSGGDFIGLDMTPDDISNLFWMLHALNAALATPRQVTAEGVS